MSEVPKEQADDIPSPESISGPKGEVVAKCEEFTLYANGWLESSPKVERALWRATLGISNRKGSEERLELALVFLIHHEASLGVSVVQRAFALVVLELKTGNL